MIEQINDESILLCVLLLCDDSRRIGVFSLSVSLISMLGKGSAFSSNRRFRVDGVDSIFILWNIAIKFTYIYLFTIKPLYYSLKKIKT